MKLLRFLECRLQGHAPKSLLHKWIRSGQVRVNKGRAGPYHLLKADDTVRVPPFAVARPVQEAQEASCLAAGSPALGPGLRIIAQTDDYMVLAKDSGLPTQPGSANADSVAGRLRSAFSGAAFIPAPAHRLDKNTSGLLLAGKSHAAQRRLHELFRENAIHRDYLAWVPGVWPHENAVLLQDTLARQDQERCGHDGKDHPGSQEARSVALPLRTIELHDPALPRALQDIREATLLLLRLLTGRKRQIRLQLSSRAFPIIGDVRHGGTAFPLMLLHAFALALPPEHEAKLSWSLLPEWPAPFAPGSAPLHDFTPIFRAASPRSATTF